jgi:hypothetical protein
VICAGFAGYGLVLDARDAAARAAPKAAAPPPASLEAVVATSLPTCVADFRHPVRWAARLVWKYHSWFRIVSAYVPATPRPRARGVPAGGRRRRGRRRRNASRAAGGGASSSRSGCS